MSVFPVDVDQYSGKRENFDLIDITCFVTVRNWIGIVDLMLLTLQSLSTPI